MLGIAPFPYRLLALALLAVALFGFGWIKGASHAEGKLAAFQAETRTAGEIAAKAAQVQEAKDRQRKEASDASYTKALAQPSADNRRLHDARSGGGNLPTAPTDTRSPDLACFDRSDLERAIRRLDAGVSGLVGEGDQVALRLRLAVEWAAK